MQGGGLLERPAVNLQTATQSGIGTGQEARNLTAQLHLVSTFPPPAVSSVPSLLTKPLFLSMSKNLGFPILNSASTQREEERT